MTDVVNIKINPAAKQDPRYVYCGRGSIWGNPFMLGKDGNRKEVVQRYINYLTTRQDLIDQLAEIKGKMLGCFCAPQLCHCDVLAFLADYIVLENGMIVKDGRFYCEGHSFNLIIEEHETLNINVINETTQNHFNIHKLRIN